MKNMTIWQRLNTALFVLILLLVIGAGLALWIEHATTLAVQRSEELEAKKERIHFDVTQMSDVVRGLLLDPHPRDDIEGRRREAAEKDLRETDFTTYGRHLGVIRAVKNIQDFAVRTLIPFQNRVVKLADTNAGAAIE